MLIGVKKTNNFPAFACLPALFVQKLIASVRVLQRLVVYIMMSGSCLLLPFFLTIAELNHKVKKL